MLASPLGSLRPGHDVKLSAPRVFALQFDSPFRPSASADAPKGEFSRDTAVMRFKEESHVGLRFNQFLFSEQIQRIGGGSGHF